MTSRILGLGTATPPHSLTQADAADLAIGIAGSDRRHARVLSNLYRRTSVETRGVCLLADSELGEPCDLHSFYAPVAPKGAIDPGSARGPSTAQRMAEFQRHAPVLGARAGHLALDDARIPAADITHLVTVTCTGFVAPGFELGLIERIDLQRTVQRTHVGFMGCHGALNGLQTARAITRADEQALVLVCCVELCSLHLQYGRDPQHIVPNALFADGAGAVVVGAPAEDDSGHQGILATATRIIPGTAEDMTWRIGDHGFEMTLSPSVPDILAANLRPWLDDWLAACDLAVGDVGSWAIHAGGPRIVSAVADSLGLHRADTAAARDVLRLHGNMSSATVLFILDRLRVQGRVSPTVVLGFGPGLTAEAALLG